MRRRGLVTIVGVAILASGSLSARAAVAGPPPESLTLLSTTPVHVTSSTHKHLLLSLDAVRFSTDPTQSDLHSAGTVSVTLSNLAKTETHEWTFNIGADSFETTTAGDGHLRTGSQVAPYGTVNTAIAAERNAKQQCGAGNFQVNHKVAVKGKVALKTHSSGPHRWGTVDDVVSLHGTLVGGHGADNEEACSAIPCVSGVTWIANKGLLSISGQNVARNGKKPASTIDANRLVHLTTPAHATRTDDVSTTAPAPTFSTLNGHKTLSVTTNSSGPAQGDAALSATSHGPYAQGCATGQEKGKLWGARYVTPDLPLTFSEDIFGPLSISKSKSANFENYHMS